MTPVALTIAGSDASGGAGLQADLKTFQRFNVYGEAVVTLITVQNTLSVSRVEVLDAELVRQQIEAVLSDIPPLAIKTGALGNRAVVEAVVAALGDQRSRGDMPLIVDPVMISSAGAPLLDSDGRKILVKRLFPEAYLLMPNLAEAAALVGFPVTGPDSMVEAGRVLRGMGPRNVLIKGGHLSWDAIDVLVTENDSVEQFSAPRILTRHTHGTGCTYSAAITAELAKGTPLIDSIQKAKSFVTSAIQYAPGLGTGNGPLNHLVELSFSSKSSNFN